MKNIKIMKSLSVAVLLTMSIPSFADESQIERSFVSEDTMIETSVLTDEAEQLSIKEIEKLLFMREEEKVARDVYLTLYEQWKNPIFKNIAQSEQIHMDAMALLLVEFNLDDPVVDDTVGLFTDPELATMYEELVLKGQQSMHDALHVGGLIEEVDIEDIQHGVEETNQEQIIKVYENLLKGSRNHLRAFVRQIENMGIEYEAQHIDADVVYEIVDSPFERG